MVPSFYCSSSYSCFCCFIFLCHLSVCASFLPAWCLAHKVLLLNPYMCFKISLKQVCLVGLKYTLSIMLLSSYFKDACHWVWCSVCLQAQYSGSKHRKTERMQGKPGLHETSSQALTIYTHLTQCCCASLGVKMPSLRRASRFHVPLLLMNNNAPSW